jgi:hypothetical protein
MARNCFAALSIRSTVKSFDSPATAQALSRTYPLMVMVLSAALALAMASDRGAQQIQGFSSS